MIFYVLDGLCRGFHYILMALLYGMGYLDVRGGDEDMDQVHVGVETTVDILLDDPGQAAYLYAQAFVGDILDRLELASGRYGKTSFYDAHTKLVELPGDGNLLFGRQGDSRCLFTIAEGGIENFNSFVTQCIGVIENDPTLRILAP